jgi:predicted molibdopterin-dependent oxidoreductase YjgC
MLTTLQQAKRRGCRLVHINPLPEVGMTRFKHPQQLTGWFGSGTELADLFLQVRINGDVALLKGLSKAVLARDGVLDHEFINRYTSGFEEFASSLQAVFVGRHRRTERSVEREDRTGRRDLCRV